MSLEHNPTLYIWSCPRLTTRFSIISHFCLRYLIFYVGCLIPVCVAQRKQESLCYHNDWRFYTSGCDCNGNAAACIYNQTLDVAECVDCTKNSYGRHCDLCVDGYFSDSDADKNTVCQGMPEKELDNGECYVSFITTI